MVIIIYIDEYIIEHGGEQHDKKTNFQRRL